MLREFREKDYITILGNTLVIMSNQCIGLDVWEDCLEQHPKCKSKNLANFVFEDNDGTYSPEYLTIKRQREAPLTVDYYVYESASITEPVLKQIIEGLRLMDLNNSYDDSTGLVRKYLRHSKWWQKSLMALGLLFSIGICGKFLLKLMKTVC